MDPEPAQRKDGIPGRLDLTLVIQMSPCGGLIATKVTSVHLKSISNGMKP